MKLLDTRTPSLSRPPRDPSPYFADLVDLEPENDGAYPYSDKAAYLLSVAAGWAYSDEETFREVMARIGFVDADCRIIAVQNDAMLVAATAYLLRTHEGLALLCFRGTEPRNVINWLTDASVDRVPFLQCGAVHGGFFRNVQAVWPQIVEKLLDPVRGNGSRPKALYITGHSLGAAMAALTAMRLWFDPSLRPVRDTLRGVYTFGQPMVAEPELAHMCDERLGKIVYRHVYDHDIVPRLPPMTTGSFAHFGQELGSVDGRWRMRSASVSQAYSAVVSVPIGAAAWVFRQLPLLRWVTMPYSWEDHSPLHYIECSKLEGGTELNPITFGFTQTAIGNTFYAGLEAPPSPAAISHDESSAENVGEPHSS